MVELIIFTMNYKNPYTGGIRFTNSLVDFAKANYSKITIIDFAQLPKLIRRFRLITIFYFLYFFLIRRNFHAVIDHSLHFRLCLPAIFNRKRYSVLFFQKFYHLRSNPFTFFIQYLTEKSFLINASQIIVPSQSAKNDVKKLGIREEIIHVVNPTVSIKGDGAINKNMFHGTLLFIGQIAPWKGLDILIQALSIIKDIPFHLDIVGRCDINEKYFHQIKKMIQQYCIESKIKFHGQKTGTALKKLFKNADIFTFPSRSETFGIVLLEAMSFGLPIVATAIPSTLELIKDNENGIICPIDDPKELADALRLVLTNSELRKKFSETNLERSKTILLEEEVAAQVFNQVKPFLKSNS